MQPTQAEILKAIDKLVREGRAVHTMIDGKPGLKLVEKPQAKADGQETKECGK